MVDAGDAPMPAAQIDVTSPRTPAAPADISGVGYLVAEPTRPSSTAVTALGTTRVTTSTRRSTTSTSRPPTARSTPAARRTGAVQPTGIDGSADPDGFNGFLVKGAVPELGVRLGDELPPVADSNCLEYRSLFERSSCTTARFRTAIARCGVLRRARRGRRVLRAWSRLLLRQPRVIKNSNGGCDLKNVDVLGTSHVVARLATRTSP